MFDCCAFRNQCFQGMSECGVECIASIIVVGFLWGATNPLLRYASRKQDSQMAPEENEGFAKIVSRFLRSFLNWKFSIPFAANQLGSIMFNLLVINFPVTVVVPCVNAIQFIATFIVGIAMGEQMQQSTVKQKTGMVLAMIAILGMLVIE
ncbi:hypothetical protein B9Z55_001881 [Caenorhabditis nigoni]|uniref:Transmembrane protein 234 n=2 Tax=Caenorhabditis nigoni TaxID=1611254 RepID=A0A2G5VIA8_9PELO|nr:hypothetical protein B9Z55_001881 [Caenorhabditis nigoni]